MDLIYMLPFFINDSKEYFNYEMNMAKECFESLKDCGSIKLIIYNQGILTNKEIENLLNSYSNISYDIMGSGVNEGIPKARYRMLKYIFDKYSEAKYIAEIHLDMIFTPNWDKPLIEYLENSDEPIISPRILIQEECGKYRFIDNEIGVDFPSSLLERVNMLNSCCEDRVIEGFAHPIIHKVEILKNINPYDVGFLTGKQGYEDDSIILGYNYYIGTRHKWSPKISFKTCVYHKGVGQRDKVDNINIDFNQNVNGLNAQYGAYGFKELYRITGKSSFLDLYNQCVRDKEAYKYANFYNDDYASRYIVTTDINTNNCLLKFPMDWWSRLYEYPWAMKFVKKDDRCLDAACGAPHPFKFYLSSVCGRVWACDIDEDIIDNNKILSRVAHYFSREDVVLAKKYIDRIDFKRADLTKLPYDDEMFTKVFCISVIEHLSLEAIKDTLKEFYRVLQSNGLLILTVDIPTANLQQLLGFITEVGFKFAGEAILDKPNNAIYSTLLGGLNCFRLLLKK